jgi:hypothetical protein
VRRGRNGKRKPKKRCHNLIKTGWKKDEDAEVNYGLRTEENIQETREEITSQQSREEEEEKSQNRGKEERKTIDFEKRGNWDTMGRRGR